MNTNASEPLFISNVPNFSSPSLKFMSQTEQINRIYRKFWMRWDYSYRCLSKSILLTMVLKILSKWNLNEFYPPIQFPSFQEVYQWMSNQQFESFDFKLFQPSLLTWKNQIHNWFKWLKSFTLFTFKQFFSFFVRILFHSTMAIWFSM